ncbi:DHA2 family efflux MFS transporter permease subunit [Chromobacterium amazonense]|uniref:DHA2 family efflux MFS transporter permease subunit n=1 Tax=Chromobacterium amazonense TaxID=1382803 RepID=A0ABU8V6Q2_9NEIS|nr:DHA2 family efflux MFS transporter permease subunit [Chromobacterium amazonense]MDQ4541091.1 DHA2 family efflux MFS transporter permease subunit [Chromobacterium amazonense]
MKLKIAPGMVTPLIVATALFMENMDSTVISTSLPAIARDLAVDPISLKLALTSYLVSLAVFIPISGWMADRFGARRIFRSAIVVFMLGSLLCAATSSLHGFVMARFLQGIGGAMMVPVGRLVILRTIDKADLVRALSYLTVPALLGPVIGPPLGGFISTYFHWRWIFLINIPIGLLGLALAGRFIANLKEDDVPKLDLAGFVFTGAGLSMLMLGLASEGKHMLSAQASIWLTVIGAALLLAYLWHYRRQEHPLLDLSLLRLPTFHAGVVGGFMFRVGIGTIPFLLPLMLQLGFGFSPFESGLLTCSTAMGAIGMKTVVAKVLQQFGFRRVLILNSILAGCSVAVYVLFQADTPHWVLLAVFVLGGCLRSLQFTSLNAITFADVGKDRLSHATSLSSVAQQLAAGFGVTVGAFALQSAAWLQGHPQLQADDFGHAFLIMGGLTALSSLLFVRLAPNAGQQVSAGHEGGGK